jgi:hypothetical protein
MLKILALSLVLTACVSAPVETERETFLREEASFAQPDELKIMVLNHCIQLRDMKLLEGVSMTDKQLRCVYLGGLRIFAEEDGVTTPNDILLRCGVPAVQDENAFLTPPEGGI